MRGRGGEAEGEGEGEGEEGRVNELKATMQSTYNLGRSSLMEAIL